MEEQEILRILLGEFYDKIKTLKNLIPGEAHRMHPIKSNGHRDAAYRKNLFYVRIYPKLLKKKFPSPVYCS